jgi:ribosomal protein L37E
MVVITFETPVTCSRCGGHNFKIQGVIYNGEMNYTKLSVKCMKCGTPAETIQQPNM